MGQANLDFYISDKRLKKLSRYIAPRIPLVAQGQKITVDETALDGLLLEALRASSSFRLWPPLKKNKSPLPPKKVKRLKKMLRKQFNNAAENNIPFDASELEKEAAETKRTLMMAGPHKLTAEGYTQDEKVQIFKEWLCIRHALVKAGAHLETVQSPPKEGGYREVYTRDRYVVVGDTAYLPDPRKLEEIRSWPEEIEPYQREIDQIEKALQDRGVKTVMVKGAWFEGGNVVRHYSSQTLFVGIDGGWSSEGSAQKLISAINGTQQKNWSLLPVPLTNRYVMYHLDTGMSEELPHGEVMISPQVTNDPTYQKIRDIVGAKKVIELSNDEAKNLATNMIDVGNTLVMTGTCDSIRKRLVKKGYKVVMPDDYGQQNFEFGKGGVHCMTNDVKQPQPRGKRRAPAP